MLLGCVLVLAAVGLTSGQQGEVIKTKGAGGVEPPTNSSTTGGSTTGTTATTGTTSGGTTGTTSGGDGTGYGFAHATLLKLEERLGQNSAWLVSGSAQTSAARHVLKLKLRTVYTDNWTSDQWGNDIGMTEAVTDVAIPVGSELGGLPTLPLYSVQTLSILSNPSQNYIVTSNPNQYGMGSWDFVVQRGSSAVLSGGEIKFYTKIYRRNSILMGTGPGGQPIYNVVESNYWEEVKLQASKLPLEAISLDSRRVYGKANLDGELPGDPNAELSTNNFQPCVYKGGHFVGNMPYGSSHDQSGTSRLSCV